MVKIIIAAIFIGVIAYVCKSYADDWGKDEEG
jgi:hypothetical protein